MIFFKEHVSAVVTGLLYERVRESLRMSDTRQCCFDILMAKRELDCQPKIERDDESGETIVHFESALKTG
jgi:hypothetical protein